MPDKDHTTSVEYRDIPGFPGYRVGSDGSIWSRLAFGPRGGMNLYWRQRVSTPHPKTGYLVLPLNRDKKPHYRLVHRVVLETFVGPCPDGMECRHKDGNPMNNHLDNLEWATHQANEDDKKIHGTRPRGEKHTSAKLTEADVIEIRRLHAAGGITKLAIVKRYGLHHSTILSILARESWTHI